MLLFLILSFSAPVNATNIPNFETLLMGQNWHAFQTLLNSDQKVLVNLKPLLLEKGKMSHSQTLYCFRKFFQKYKVIGIQQNDFRCDTNYSQVEISVQYRVIDRQSGKNREGSFLLLLTYRQGKPLLSRWQVTDFHS